MAKYKCSECEEVEDGWPDVDTLGTPWVYCECGGEMYKEESINQCDGCRRGLPLEDGAHRGPVGYDLIGCTKDRYTKRNKQ